VTTRVTTGGRPARPSSTEPLEHHQCDTVVTILVHVFAGWCGR
jgi:hypothetical protein